MAVSEKKVRLARYKPARRTFSIYYYKLFLTSLTVAVHELINTTCRVNQFALTCIEWVRCTRDFDFYHWVSFTFKFHCLCCFAGGLCKEHITVGHILEYDGAIVFWMNTFFLFFTLLLSSFATHRTCLTLYLSGWV